MSARRSVSLGLASLCALAAALLIFSTSAHAATAREYVPAGSFGSEGSGNGKFKEPAGVAVNDATHNVYVVDKGNDRVEEFTSTGAYIGQFDGVGASTGVFSSPEAIAVDNSGSALDTSKEDVYVVDSGHRVVDQFTASGTYVGQLKETTAGSSLGDLHAIAVDPAGNVWVDESSEEGSSNTIIDEFSDTGGFVKALTVGRSTGPESSGLAIDSGGNLYLNFCCEGRVAKFASTTGKEVERFSSEVSDLALNPATDDPLLDRRSSIALYGPDGEPYSTPLQTFSGEGLSESYGIGVDGATGTAYATQRAADDVAVFKFVSFPEVTSASPVSADEATLHGSVDPEGEPITECKFEYGIESTSEHSAPCEQTPSGTSPEPVTAKLSGLEARVTYRFQLTVVVGSSTRSSGELTFYTVDKPEITGESVSNVGLTTATVGAQINPAGLPTTYRVEYGPTTEYGASTPETSLGAGVQAASVQIRLSGLQPATLYHARVVARNEAGTAVGGDLTFTTTTANGSSTSTLPDGRAYEMVSPVVDGNGEVYVPSSGHALESLHQTLTGNPVRAAADGNAVVYSAEPPPEGGNGVTGDGAGNVFLATRSETGWSAQSIMPPGAEGENYQGFSSDLSLAFLDSDESLASGTPTSCEGLYSRTTSDGIYNSLLTSTQTPEKCGHPLFAGVSADGSHVIFESEAPLTSNAVAGDSTELHRKFNLYVSVAGQLHLVNVLPNGTTDANSTFGGVSDEEEEGDLEYIQERPGYFHFGQVISDDGSRIVWTDLDTGDLYVRENAESSNASTVQVDASVGGGGQYRGASADGSEVFFTKAGDLYGYNLETATTTDLAHGNVLGVLGVSEDGSYVYFAAGSVLAGNENANGEKAVEGEPNLYVRSAGETTFIATLSSEDNAMIGPSGSGESPKFGDWRPSFKTRTAEVAPDGQHLVFMSRRSLTGYDNMGGCVAPEGGAVVGCPEVFIYEAGTHQLSCASCNPDGEPPVAAHTEPVAVGGAFLPNVGQFATGTYQLRWMSEDGSRVFFDSSEPLVPQDTNGVQDVYEWERAGAGSCRQSPGCIFLISGTLSNEEAYFVDASTSGNDVFFTTRAQLVPQDRNGVVDIYDARVGGGFPEVSQACTGTGCQGVPPAAPIFATPASVTFNGVGNFAPAPKVAIKPKVTLKKCKRGFSEKHGRCVKNKAKKSSRRSKPVKKKSSSRSKNGRRDD